MNKEGIRPISQKENRTKRYCSVCDEVNEPFGVLKDEK